MRNRVLCTFAVLLLSISAGRATNLLRTGSAAAGAPVKKSAFLFYDFYDGMSDMVGNIDLSIWDAYKRHFIAGLALLTLQTLLIIGLLIHHASRRKAERALKENRQVLQSTIDALDAHVALLDETGKIIAVNQRWTQFADANGYVGAAKGLGTNYLEVCESSIECEEARLVLSGIRRLMSGESDDFRCVYPCHSTQEAWFQVRINRFYIDGLARLVVAHENVTEIQQAQNAHQQLSGLLIRAQDEERRRISHDLHDVTVQNIASIKADLSRLQQIDNLRVILTMKESLSLCDQVIKELRTLSYLLHPPLLDEVGLIPALQWFIRGFMQHSGIQVKIVVTKPIGRLEPSVETALFRVAQECLTNIHRHSGSPTALIWVIKQRDEVMLRITDKGQGISEPRFSGGESIISTGVGIMGMRQRVRQLGGKLEIHSTVRGTTVTARISLTGETHAAHSNC
jgi:two-component system NarL family sensor kinase